MEGPGVRVRAAMAWMALAAVMATGCARDAFKHPSLYQRLGGKGGLVLIVDGWLARAAADARLARWIDAGSVDRLRPQLVEQLCALSGGPCRYTGRDMRSAHAGLRIDAIAYDAMLDALTRSLTRMQVPAEDQKALMQLLAPLRKDVVGS